MVSYCPECGSEETYKTGGQRHHAYEYGCDECGNTFYWG